MKFSDELKRVKTAAFWEEVRYWAGIKWSGKLTKPVASEDWLPILTGLAITVILFTISVILYGIFT